MKTTKPFSTVSYNTPEFLKQKLDVLVQKRRISFYTFIRHYAEEDEKKDHIHLHIIPNGQIQTDSLSDYLQELDPAKPDKPLGVTWWQSSKWTDWYLYACHDIGYLASKGHARVHHYEESDFVSSDEDSLHELVTTIDRTKYTKTLELVKKAQNGEDFFDMVTSGLISVRDFYPTLQLYQYVSGHTTFRNGRSTHTPKVDEETGEVVVAPSESAQSDDEAHFEEYSADDDFELPMSLDE